MYIHKFHKITHYFSFDVLKKKIWANFQRIIELFTQKIVNKLSKIFFWDPGSEIRDPGSGKNLFRIPDPGSRGQKGTGSRIPDPDPQHWLVILRSYRVRSQNTELTRGPTELLQFIRVVHICARALHVLNLIWFGNISRQSQWGGGG